MIMKTRVRMFAVIVVLAMVPSVRAQTLNFLGEKAVDPISLLPDPPAPNSEEGRSELDWMLAIQQQRTRQQVARCRAEVRLRMSVFQGVMGPWFTAENLPRLDRLFGRVARDGQCFVTMAKTHFNRQRPAVEDKRIAWAVQSDASLAYPSGHSTWAMLFAMLLADLVPERRAALLERGREIGWDRVIAGAHHPSDVVAGRVLGQALWRALQASPQFRGELAAVNAELREAQRRQPATPAAAVRAAMTQGPRSDSQAALAVPRGLPQNDLYNFRCPCSHVPASCP
jgi:acid phosphatase (class A)